MSTESNGLEPSIGKTRGKIDFSPSLGGAFSLEAAKATVLDAVSSVSGAALPDYSNIHIINDVNRALYLEVIQRYPKIVEKGNPIRDVIPEYWDKNLIQIALEEFISPKMNLETASDQQVIMALSEMGRPTLEQMRHGWERRESERTHSLENHITKMQSIMFLAGSIKEWGQDKEQVMATLRGIVRNSVAHIATAFDNPVFSEDQIGTSSNTWGDETREPLDPESRRRKFGTTTFNKCGWCTHHGGGSGRFNYLINTVCTFDYPIDRESRYDNLEERYFDSPCFLPAAPDTKVDEIVLNLIAGQVYNQTQIVAIRERMAIIDRALEIAKDTPAISSERPAEWFNKGEEAVMYMEDWHGQLVPNGFIVGKVFEGYRYHDGGAHVDFGKKIHGGSSRDGAGGEAGFQHPLVMKKWELDYMRSPEGQTFARFYARTIDTDRHDPEKILDLILNGPVMTP